MSRKPVILCVDDESMVLSGLKEQLKREFGDSISIEVAESGEMALEIADELYADGTELPLVISDQIMPGIKGDELLIKIHERHPATLKILLTGQANAEAVGNAVNRAGLYRYISKPWESSDLNLTIREALRRYTNEKEIAEKTHTLSRNAEIFYKYVPAQFLKLLNYDEQNYRDIKLGLSVEKEMTVLFSDIRSFTSMCEFIPTESIFKFINDYLAQMTPIIHKHNGFIDKYMGDAIMALFESPEAALSSAIEMLRALTEYNQKLQEAGSLPIAIGIGINSGPMVLGTLGDSQRMQTTVIGDTVNIAARVESLTKTFRTPLLIAERTYAGLKNKSDYSTRLIDRVEVEGKSIATDIYEVLDVMPEPMRTNRINHRSEFETAVRAFQNNKNGTTRGLFEALIAKSPDDRIALDYLNRC